MTDLTQYTTDAGFLHDGGGVYLKNDAAIVTETLASGLSSSVVTLSAAQILALHTTGIEVIAAPGDGKAVIPRVIEMFYDHGTTAYGGIAGGDDFVLRYTNVSGGIAATIETTGFIDQTSNQTRVVINSGSVTPTANAPLVIALAGAVTTGDGIVKIVVHSYDVVTLAS